MAVLLDHRGQPIDAGKLKEEVAAPMVMSVRSIVSGHPAQNLTPWKLREILLAAELGDPIPYLELAEEIEEKWPHYLSVLGTRKRAVAQLDITVEAAGTDADSLKDADLVRDWLARDTLQAELQDVLDAVGKGFSYTEIIWELGAKQWMPKELKLRDPRWFLFDRVDGETPLLRDLGPPTPLDPYKFIVHHHKAKSGLPIRGGLTRCLAWFYLFANFDLKDWMAFAEVFGMPLRIGKYAPGETEENIRKLARAVADIGADAAAVIASSMQIEFADGKGHTSGTPGDLYKSLADHLDQQASKATLGQTATTDAIAGGHAVGRTHDVVRRDIMKADAVLLQATLNRDLVIPIVSLNHGPRLKYPRINIGLPEAVDIKAMSAALGVLVPMGLKVGVKWARDKLGAPEPADDEPVLMAPAAPAPDAEDPSKEDATERGEEDETLDDPGDAAAARVGGRGRARATQVSPRRARAFLQPLRASYGAAAAGAEASRRKDDIIDRAAASTVSDWEPLMLPITDPIRELFAKAASLPEIRDGLAQLVDDMDVEAVAELLARSGFSARLAGLAGVDLHREEER